ncbi:MAG: glycosyltransferase family 2 protein [Dehalococcoidia bacterium]
MTADSAPALSVLVLNHNYAEYLSECLESILSQTFRDFELIVLDDASTDDSVRVIGPYLADSRVRLVAHDKNHGYTRSLIEGTSGLSRGEYLMVVSADDFALDPDAFSIQVDLLRCDSRHAACFSAYTKVGPNSLLEIRRPLPADGTIAGRDLIERQLLEREFAILHSGTMIRASAYRVTSGYRADLKNYVDLAMWIALGNVGSFAYVNRPLYAYRIHDAQLSGSGSRRRDMLREGLRVLRETAADADHRGIGVTVSGALRTRVADLALADAFANRRRMALLRCMDAAMLEPRAALTASGWWLALSRASVGAWVWEMLASARGRVS